MLINWFTVVAQIVNFLILVALLKIFLYDRIIAAMDRREDRIRSRLETAEEKQAEAERERRTYEERRREMESRRGEILKSAREEAEEKREALIEAAREEADALQRRWRDTLEADQEAFLRELRTQASQGVYDVARRTLKDLARADVHNQAVDLFLERLDGLDDDERRRMAESAAAEGRLRVRTGFPVDDAQRERITEALGSHFGEDISPEFETDPDLILGISLRTADRKLAWTVADYLADLEEKARRALDEQSRREARSADETNDEAAGGETGASASPEDGPDDG